MDNLIIRTELSLKSDAEINYLYNLVELISTIVSNLPESNIRLEEYEANGLIEILFDSPNYKEDDLLYLEDLEITHGHFQRNGDFYIVLNRKTIYLAYQKIKEESTKRNSSGDFYNQSQPEKIKNNEFQTTLPGGRLATVSLQNIPKSFIKQILEATKEQKNKPLQEKILKELCLNGDIDGWVYSNDMAEKFTSENKLKFYRNINRIKELINKRTENKVTLVSKKEVMNKLPNKKNELSAVAGYRLVIIRNFEK